MPRPTAITVSRSVKINTGNYESRDAFASVTVELDDGDKLEEVYGAAWSTVQQQIHEQETLIRSSGDKQMPIRGLNNGPGLPKIGDIRKGAPKGENQPGRDLEYFRVEFCADASGATQSAFRDIYGNEPQELRVVLMDDNIDRVFDAWREAYVAGGMTHRCDGEYIVYPPEERGKKCTLKDHPNKDERCKPVGRLYVLIPELGRAGTFTVHTGSWNDIRELYGNLEAILSMAGRLTGIPLVLRRVQRDVSFTDEKTGKRRKYQKWLLHLEISQEWIQRRIAAMQQASLLQASNVPMLVSGEFEDDDYVVDGNTGEVVTAPQPSCDHKEAAAALGGTEQDDHLIPSATMNDGDWWGDTPPTKPEIDGERPWSAQVARSALRYNAYLRRNTRYRPGDAEKINEQFVKHTLEVFGGASETSKFMRIVFGESDYDSQRASTVVDWLTTKDEDGQTVLKDEAVKEAELIMQHYGDLGDDELPF